MSQAKTLLPGKPYFDKEDGFKEQKLLTSISFPIHSQKSQTLSVSGHLFLWPTHIHIIIDMVHYICPQKTENSRKDKGGFVSRNVYVCLHPALSLLPAVFVCEVCFFSSWVARNASSLVEVSGFWQENRLKYAYRLATAFPDSRHHWEPGNLDCFLFLACLGSAHPQWVTLVSHRFILYLFRKEGKCILSKTNA